MAIPQAHKQIVYSHAFLQLKKGLRETAASGGSFSREAQLYIKYSENRRLKMQRAARLIEPPPPR